MDRASVVKNIDAIMELYCEGCLLKSHLRKASGKAQAHRFCIEQCTVGEQLRKKGEELLDASSLQK